MIRKYCFPLKVAYNSGNIMLEVIFRTVANPSTSKMTRHILAFLLACGLLPGCKSEDIGQHYHYIGQVSFRRTYAGLENLSDVELDSVEKTNPSFMYPTHTSEDTMLEILTKLGVVDKNDLLLDKISLRLRDTILISDKNLQSDTAFINYNKNKEAGTASIQIKNGKYVYSIPIKDEVFSHTFSLFKLNDTGKTLFAFINQYYIMNGDNYEVSIYERK